MTKALRWLGTKLLLWLVVLPLLLVLLLFCATMALLVEGPQELWWGVDWPVVGKRVRRAAHVAVWGWS